MMAVLVIIAIDGIFIKNIIISISFCMSIAIITTIIVFVAIVNIIVTMSIL